MANFGNHLGARSNCSANSYNTSVTSGQPRSSLGSFGVIFRNMRRKTRSFLAGGFTYVIYPNRPLQGREHHETCARCPLLGPLRWHWAELANASPRYVVVRNPAPPQIHGTPPSPASWAISWLFPSLAPDLLRLCCTPMPGAADISSSNTDQVWPESGQHWASPGGGWMIILECLLSQVVRVFFLLMRPDTRRGKRTRSK